MSLGFKQKASMYFWNVLVSVDQFANTLLGGDPDETMSSRMGKAINEGRCKFCKVVCWVLNKIDKDHCNKSIELDEGSRSLSAADRVYTPGDGNVR